MLDNINLKDFSTITFDIWDTVLRRKCDPEEIKIHTCRELFKQFPSGRFESAKELYEKRLFAEKLLGRYQRIKGNSAEFTFEQVHDFLAKFMGVKDVAAFIQTAKAIELKREQEVTYPDPTFLQWAKSNKSTKLIYVSDFYHNTTFIQELLKYHKLDKYFIKGYVSCEFLKAKRDGWLFDIVKEQENTNWSDWLHVGDNQHSDVLVPKSKGIATLHHEPEMEHMLRILRAQKFEDIQTGHYWQLEPGTPKNEGRFMAPILLAFIQGIIQKAIAGQHKKVYFFAREGYFFKEIFDQCVKQLQLPIKSVIVQVSRKATFMASLHDTELKSFELMWSQYANQTPKAFANSISLMPDKFKELFFQYGFDWDTPMITHRQNQKLIALWGDEQFQTLLKEERYTQNKLLTKYVKTLIGKEEKVLVVDVGWRGTIQDNLARCFPHVQWEGIYMGLQPFINPQLINCTKQAVFYDMNLDQSASTGTALSFVAPLEFISNVSIGSVLGYSRDSVGKVIPILQDNAKETNSFEEYITPAQQGIKERCEELMQDMLNGHIDEQDILNQALKIWQIIQVKPPKLLYGALVQSHHDETFGVGSYKSFGTNLSNKEVIQALFSKRKAKALINKTKTIPWHKVQAKNKDNPLLVRMVFRVLPYLWWIKQKFRKS